MHCRSVLILWHCWVGLRTFSIKATIFCICNCSFAYSQAVLTTLPSNFLHRQPFQHNLSSNGLTMFNIIARNNHIWYQRFANSNTFNFFFVKLQILQTIALVNTSNFFFQLFCCFLERLKQVAQSFFNNCFGSCIPRRYVMIFPVLV